MKEAAVIATVAIAGIMRGTTGFGGAMLMAPPLSVLIGPVPTVVTALMLETTAALVMFRDAWPRINKPILLYLTVPACFTVPIGGYFLITIDPLIGRKVIAAVVVIFGIMLLSGLRFSSASRRGVSILLSTVVGILLGATSVGAPPVILYLLSGPDPQVVTRANLAVFVTIISALGLAMLVAAGAVTMQLTLSVLLLCIPCLMGIWGGSVLFARLSDTGVRRFALVFMLSMGALSLMI